METICYCCIRLKGKTIPLYVTLDWTCHQNRLIHGCLCVFVGNTQHNEIKINFVYTEVINTTKVNGLYHCMQVVIKKYELYVSVAY